MDLTAYMRERRGQLFRETAAAAEGDGVYKHKREVVWSAGEKHIAGFFR